jgi:tetratricopeptide (TPR) repeat protein
MPSSTVHVRRAPVVIPTYRPQPPDKNPMFLERRVYQGSSGRVYPLPCVERFDEKKTDRAYDSLVIENEFLEVMILPELGGRIHAAKDKTNGYDFLYRNEVIKPALIGLAGSWASGGIEFNWPQHHRPSTFMPCDVEIEEHADGSKTIWLSEHDPLFRMKGMHGVCLHPGRSVIELKVRAYNRTPFVQTFLWWANVATRVHEGYQSFLPPDVTHVADHAKGSTSTFPLCDDVYYGVNYAERAKNGVPVHERPPAFVPPHCRDGALPDEIARLAALGYAPNDLTWYANIPVPTSYMCLGSKEDFFGGYDHFKQAGLVHVANHHISPGKKQWTWGNHAFGYAWDRNLTDAEPGTGEHPPYIELMAGVYTDNQPDFSFLQPGETKTWSQFWYPIQGIGPAQKASVDAALSLAVRDGSIRIGAITTRVEPGATVRLERHGKKLLEKRLELAPDRPFVALLKLPAGAAATELRLTLLSGEGRELLVYQSRVPEANEPAPATEPPPPAEVATIEELYLNGLHLAQYRHPTRMAGPYFEEALRRDPSDARCNLALGNLRLINADFEKAEAHFRTAIARLTHRNPNPYDGEAYYQLGLTLRYRADAAQLASDAASAEPLLADAYAALYKSTWNQAWQPAAYHALAEIDCRRRDWHAALDHLDRALRVNTDNLKARDLRALVLRRLDRAAEADALLRATRALDPLDWWCRHLLGEDLRCDSQTRLDLAHDIARAGFYSEALDVLAPARPEPTAGTAPTLAYTRAWLHRLQGDAKTSAAALRAAQKAARDYCFPHRVEEAIILAWAAAHDPRDARARYYLGNLYYDRKRHHEAIALWEQSAKLEPDFSIVWRNLGIGYFNILEEPEKARRAYERAYALAPTDARLVFERDLLWKRLGTPAAKRLAALEKHLPQVRLRDDLSVEYADLLNQVGRHEDALAYLGSRRFQPWEGGEGLARTQHERTHLALGRRALAAGDAARALKHFETALVAPPNLGETKHLLANRSDIDYWLGCAAAALGDHERAKQAWTAAANFRGDFQERAVRVYSEMTYFSALSLQKLGRKAEARKLFAGLKTYAKRLFKEEAKVYYFATSLPARLLFDNLQRRQETTALLIEAQAEIGLGNKPAAKKLLQTVLQRDPARALAADLLATL